MTLFKLLLLAVVIFSSWPAGAADKTNSVTSVTSGYVMDGVLRPEFYLVRGHSYLFSANNAPSLHPFKLTTSSVGGGGTPIFTNRVTGAQPCCGSGCGGTSFVFSPNSTTPDLIYYGCNVHQSFGNKIHIVNPPEFFAMTTTNAGFIGMTYTSAYLAVASVQRATDLVSNEWVTIQTVTNTGGSFVTAVSNALDGEYYRIATPLP